MSLFQLRARARAGSSKRRMARRPIGWKLSKAPPFTLQRRAAALLLFPQKSKERKRQGEGIREIRKIRRIRVLVFDFRQTGWPGEKRATPSTQGTAQAVSQETRLSGYPQRLAIVRPAAPTLGRRAERSGYA